MPRPKRRGKILVIRGGAIGDFILTAPALRALRERFAEARIEVLGYPHIASLAVAAGLADAVEPIESRAMAGFFAKGGDLNPRLGDYFAGFDLAVSYLYDPDLIFAENFARMSQAQFIQGPHRPDEKANLHATDAFLQPLERLAIFGADRVPRLRFETPPTLLPPERPWIAIHPGSGSESKNWPRAHWRELVGRFRAQTGWNVMLLGGEAEREWLPVLASAHPAEPCPVALGRPLDEVGRLLGGCSLYLGHDSGISHLAAAVGTRAMILWGPTQESVWRPLGDHVSLIRAGDALHDLPPDSVWERIRATLERHQA